MILAAPMYSYHKEHALLNTRQRIDPVHLFHLKTVFLWNDMEGWHTYDRIANAGPCGTAAVIVTNREISIYVLQPEINC